MIASVLLSLILLILSFLFGSKPIYAATRSWSFDLAENYTFNSNIEVVEGMAQLKDQPYSVDDETVGLWHLDEASGILYDATENHNDLIPSGGPTYGADGADDEYHTSLPFDGTDDYLYISDEDQEGLDITDEITIEAWIKREEDSGKTEEIISKWESKGHNRAYELMITDGGQLMFRVSKDGKGFEKIISDSTLPLNTWTHIAGVYDGNYLRLFINGVPAADPVAYDQGIARTKADFQIAKGSHFKGKIDEIRVSNIARTSFFAYSSNIKSTIQPINSQTFTSLSGLNETAIKNGGEVYYQLSNDSGSSWRYWDGTSWNLTGATDYNTASVVHENISSFPTGEGNFLFKAFLSSDGTQLVQLDNIQISYNNAPNAPLSLGPPNYVDGSWGNDNTPTLEFTQSDPDSGDTVKYRIQIDDNSDFGSLVVDYTSALISQGVTSFTLGQALVDGHYYWRVRSEDNNGATSSWATANSGSLAFKVDTAVPVNIGIYSITPNSPSQLTITALKATDAGAGLPSSPYWFNEISGNPGASDSADWQASPSFADDGLSANTQYTYQVKAKDVAGNESSYSATFSKYTLANQVTDLEATNATDKTSYKINLSWTNQSQSGMKIEQDTNCDGYETTLYDHASANATPPYRVLVAANTCYQFRISSYNGEGVLNTTSIPETSQMTTGNTLPLSENSERINSNTGGLVTLDDLVLKVPPAYLTTSVTFRIQKFASSDVLGPISTPPGKTPVGLYSYDLDAYIDATTTVSSFDQPIAITLSYSDSDIAGIDESSLLIYRRHGTDWNQLSSCVIDTSAKAVTCETTSFSIFVLFGQESSDPSSSSSSSATSLLSTSGCDDTPPGSKAPWLYGAISQGPNSIELYFTEADEPLDRYVLEYGLESENYLFGADNIGGKGARTYLVQHLSPNTTYYFRVRAGHGCATGPWSNEISAKTTSFVSLSRLEADLVELKTTSSGGESLEEMRQKGEYIVKVKVIDLNKNPVQGAKVILYSAPKEAITDEQGVTVFENVENGEHKLVIVYKNQVAEQKVNLEGGVKEFNFTVQIRETGSFLNSSVMLVVSFLLLVTGCLLFRMRRRKVEV